MNWNLKENNKQKHQFRSYYCSSCKQVKPCHTISQEYCCSCAYQIEKEKAEEYSDYQQVYQREQQEKKEYDRQLLLLKNYLGCLQCGSKEVDAYFLYENNRLVCQPCRAKKDGESSSPISFLEQSKWYKRYWKINLSEWLGTYQCLPVNANCAREWVKDKEHLNSCKCLKKEVKDLVEFYTNSLKEYQEKLKGCKCEVSNKTRTPHYNWANYGYTYCEKCEVEVKGAGKHGVIKNRNDPKFWGLEVKEKVLCGSCLEEKKGEMKSKRRAKFNEYRNLGMI